VKTGKNTATFKGQTDAVGCVAFSPDGKALASGSFDKELGLWDVKTGEHRGTHNLVVEPVGVNDALGVVWSVAFSPDGKTLASASFVDRAIILWDVPPAGELKPRATLKGHTDQVWSLAFSPDGKTLASGSIDKTIRLWDVTSGKNTATLKGHTSVAYSPDGKTLASGSGDKTLRLWDVKTGKNTATFKGHSEGVLSVAYSPDGRTLASGSMANTVRLWDVASGKTTATLKGHTEPVRSVAFSPDGKALASGSIDKTVRLWDAASGKNTATLKGHTDPVLSVAYSPDSKTLASGSFDKTVRLWDVASGKNTATLRGHTRWVLSVAYSPDGKALASGSEDRTIRLWDVASGKTRASLQGDTGAVVCVAFSPDGKTLASGSSWDGTITLWDVLPAESTGPVRSTALSGKDLDGLWNALSQDDAANAYRAIGTLVRAPEQAVPLLKSRLQPVPEPDAHQITGWITDLDSARFAVRQKAGEALGKVGEQAEAALRKKLAEKPSPEVRRRIERLLTRIEQPRGESLRALRAVEVLEHIGNPEAKRVLQTLATGAEGARVTREAKASLSRLKKQAAAGK